MMYLCTIGMVLLASLGMLSVSASEIIENSHNITITSINEKVIVSEISVIQKENTDMLSVYDVWIPTDATDVRVTIENHLLQYEKLQENIYRCNLSTINLTNITTLTVDTSYNLPEITDFSKLFLRNATQVTIQFNDETIGTFSSVKDGTVISLPLTVSTEESSLFNIYIIIVILLLVIVIAVSILYSIKRKQPSQTRTRSLESEDVLQTEYELLKEMLKQIEKFHRSKKIVDDTYHKLKEYYKQQAVETMSALEQIGSKIKE